MFACPGTILTQSILNKIAERDCLKCKCSRSSFQNGCMSVIDPMDWGNNLTQSVNENTYERMIKVLKYGHARLQNCLAMDPSGEDLASSMEGQLFPCSRFVLETSLEAEDEHYFSLFKDELEHSFEGVDMLKGELTLFKQQLLQIECFL